MDYVVWLIILAVLAIVAFGIFSLGRASAMREEHERNYYPLPQDNSPHKDTV